MLVQQLEIDIIFAFKVRQQCKLKKKKIELGLKFKCLNLL